MEQHDAARLVDTHCHLQSPAFEADRLRVLDTALASLAWLVVVGDDMASSRAAVDLARDRVYAAAGIHPHHASHVNEGALEDLARLLASPGVVALGEIGLDYHYEYSPRDVQRKAFEAQLDLAARLNLPVIIHCRAAQADMAPILEAHHRHLAGGVMHCFPGGPQFAEQCLGWGLHISFAGNVTFPKAEELRESARAVPLDRLLVETDSPYLAPQPVRGKRCEPAFVRYTADALAEAYAITRADLTQRTTANATRLFGLAAQE